MVNSLVPEGFIEIAAIDAVVPANYIFVRE
jgi:hypothetical protein